MTKGELLPLLEVLYIPSENSQFFKVELEEYSCTEASETGLKIRVDFNKFAYVSTSNIKD